MSERRYEPEWALAAVFKQYLEDTLEVALFATSPAVTFYDPMAQDDANRVVILPHEVEAGEDGEANFTATVEVTVKTQTTQAKLEDDLNGHFARVNAVRGALCVAGLAAALDAVESGLGVTWVNRARQFRTDVREGWIYSETRLGVKCFARATS